MFSFTGSSRSRPAINLSGRSSNDLTSDELMRKAREERQSREKFKHQRHAVITIQSFWRSKKVLCQTKVHFRNEFDRIICFTQENQSLDHQSFYYYPPHLKVLTKSQTYHLLSKQILLFYSPGDPFDQERMVKLINILISNQDDLYTNLVQQNYLSDHHSWRNFTIPLVIKRLFLTISCFPQSVHSLTFLKSIKSFIQTSLACSEWNLVSKIGANLYWNSLKSHIIHFETNQKQSNNSLSMAIELSVLPFQYHSYSSDQFKHDFLISFLTHIFTIPYLPNRIDIKVLISFSSSLPFNDLLLITSKVIQEFKLVEIIHLLSNFLVWGSKRITSLKSIEFSAYLRSLQLCLDQIPYELFKNVNNYLKNKEISKAQHLHNQKLNNSHSSSDSHALEGYHGYFFDPIAFNNDDIELIKPKNHKDIPMASIVNNLNTKTLQWLSILISPVHLSQLFITSNKYSSTSRSIFCKLMVSIIYTWPFSKEKVLNTLIYTPLVNRIGQNLVDNNGGLMRELWRSSVRSGKIGVSLRDRKSGGSPQGVLTTLKDSNLIGHWEDLIILCELYSRCLVTLGDEEFFNDETQVSNSSDQRNNNMILLTGRNPLLLDEVVGLAGLLRNLTFGLYWIEGQADMKKDFLLGTNVSLLQLRILTTRLLQQIYTRNSRRPFCQPNFWSMTSTFDLRSFIQTVVYEESHLDDIQDEQSSPASHSNDADSDLNLLEHLPSNAIGNSRTRISKRQLAFISPRLGVLHNIPFVIPFEQRVAIFRTFIESDRHRLGLDLNSFNVQRHKASIRRNHVSEDGFLHLGTLGPKLKETIEIKFIDQYGLEEAGIDGGGVFKEFLTSLTKEVFDANKGLWLVNKNQELYPNPHSYSRDALSLEWYKFLGRVLGKALYEGILIDVDFADFFLNKWLGKQSYLDDLASLDPELYQGLLFLKHYKGDVEADLSLNFAITTNEFDKSETIDLIPNGSKTSVTAWNRINYIYLVSNYKLNVQLEAQCAAFFKGLNDIIDLKWLRMFNQVEMRVLVGGLDGQDLDIDDLQRWTVYGGWDESHPTIRIFWKVLKQFDNLTKRKLLKSAGNDLNRLPTSSTCINLLKLPEYRDENQLKEKILYSINSNAGFDLS
ncbi:hypothetical protein O181_012584 [Austropuccinia psidii MF-1]|uniref:HECT-type E3 ubiquitin transferase n=1 Tax=Austropuccinia psidii MF-1 TaxID=1389203 RepID=A0A9Q3GN04_9BASI|nr:hypothetical protein [Austropuccinia psidii MF-1]